MAPGLENGAGAETPEPVVPPRIAGRCDLRWQPKRRHRFFLHRNRTPPPLCPNGFSGFNIPAHTGPKTANAGFGGLGGAGMPPRRESPRKRPHRGKRRGTVAGGPLAVPTIMLHGHFRRGRRSHILCHQLGAVLRQSLSCLLLAVVLHLPQENHLLGGIEGIGQLIHSAVPMVEHDFQAVTYKAIPLQSG